MGCFSCLSCRARGGREQADGAGRVCCLPDALRQLCFWKPSAALPLTHCSDAHAEICSLPLVPEFSSSPQIPVPSLVCSSALPGTCPRVAVLPSLKQAVAEAATIAFSNGVFSSALDRDSCSRLGSVCHDSLGQGWGSLLGGQIMMVGVHSGLEVCLSCRQLGREPHSSLHGDA